MKSLILVSLTALFSISCVSKGKFEDLSKKHEALTEKSRQDGLIIGQLKGKLGDASSNVEEMKKALAEAAQRKAEREKRIAEYKQLLGKFQKLINSGKLNVKILRGRMVVQLDSDILFRSGSASLSQGGIQSIAEVAKVLASIEGKEFQIEGHTDDVPIRTARFPSNWELASSRATTVLKAMLEAGMAPQRISTASFAEYKPVSENSTPEGKAFNRRIEIVVVPDLSQLPGFDELNSMTK